MPPTYLSFRAGVPVAETVPPPSPSAPHPPPELMVKFPLKEIQSTRTQRPTAGSSCPYVEVALGDATAQHTVQLQLEQVGPRGVAQPPTPEFRTLGSPWPGQVLGSIQPSAGDRARSILHRPAGLKVVLERHLDGGILEMRAQVVCRRIRCLMGNWEGPNGL